MAKKTHDQEMAAIYSKDRRVTDDVAEHLHLGYWYPERTGDDLKASYDNYLEKLIANASIQSGDRILDIGCGNGAVAIWLAQKFGCRVFGVDIVKENIERAKHAIKVLGLQEQIIVENANAMTMELEECGFDHAIGTEALYHIEKRVELFRKIHKALKPGGTVNCSEFMRKRTCSWFSAQVAEVCTGSRYLWYFDEYPGMLKQCGFEVINAEDVTDRTFVKTYHRYIQDGYYQEIKRYFKEEYGTIASMLLPVFKKMVERSLGKGHWGMAFICAGK